MSENSSNLKYNEMPINIKDLPDQKSKDAIGMTVVRDVVSELFTLSEKYNIGLNKSTIINLTELVKERYSEHLTDFKVLTSNISLILVRVFRQGTYLDKEEYKVSSPYIAESIVFTDNKVKGLEQINIADLLGLMDGDMSEFPCLSKCTAHLNRLYNVDQLDMIPAIWYNHIIKY